MKRATLCLVFVALSLAVTAAAVAAEGTGTISGFALDPQRQPLPGVRVTVRGSSVEAITGLDGRFVLAPVSTGETVVQARYLGFDPATATVTVGAGETLALDLVLRPAEQFFGTVTVIGEPLLEGQAKALNQQKNSLNIVNVVAEEQLARFPDANSAEVTQRVPGLTLQRDQGEGRYVIIRGTEPRLNSMMIEGERVPAPEGDVRQVALDVIPSELLQSIEVSKALTPDMDGDAIGGAVNLVMKRAPSDPVLQASVGYGYNELNEGDANQASFAYGRRFASDRAGLMLAGSWLDTERASENFEVAYDDGDLDELEYRDYSVERERLGLAFNLDYSFSESTEIRLSSTFNQFDDQEIRRRVRNRVGDDAVERELKDRFESQTIYSLAGSGEHLFADASRLRFKLAYAYAEEDEPDAYYSTFAQEDVEFDPNVSADSIDPDDIQANPLNEDLAAFELDGLSAEDNFTSEKDVVGSVDYDRPFASSSGTAGLWRFGLKVRDKTKERDNEVFEYGLEDDPDFLDLLDSGYGANRTILSGRYPMGAFQDAGLARALFSRPDAEAEKVHDEDTADFEADETVIAAYAAVELSLSDRLMLLPGVRYEQTDTEYTGYEVRFDEEGDWASTEPVTGDREYGVVLPHLHLRYALDDSSNLRAAVTRTFARPDYADLTPYRLIIQEDREIELGNPDLDPTTSWNLDVMYERFFPTIGVVSAGVFYKSLDDFIYPFRSELEYDGETYDAFQPANGDDATLTGLELAYHNQLRRLPEPFNGLGLFVNYTWVDSEAEFPGRSDATVPGQAEHVGNLGVSYERGGFSGLVALNFHGEYLDEVGGEAAEDLYVDEHLQLDASVAYSFPGGLSLRLQLLNLTDEPYRVYEGSPDRPIQEEYYSWSGLVSVGYNFF